MLESGVVNIVSEYQMNYNAIEGNTLTFIPLRMATGEPLVLL